MSTRRHRVVFFIAALAAVVLTPIGTIAHESSAYLNADSTGVSHTDWMSTLANLRLSQLSIPGTHDSGASHFGRESTETQSMDIANQLKAGIRMFDIRLGRNDSTICPPPDLWVFHGISCQSIKFTDDVLSPMTTFLAAHPTEAIFMRIRNEHNGGDTFSADVLTDLSQYSGYFYNGNDTNPLLSDMRGKIVIFQNFTGDLSSVASTLGWDDGTQDVQDDFSLSTNWDLADKWKDSVKPQLQDADNVSDATNASTIHINFLSAAGGGFPYFFASGHSSWETSAPRLLTGWTRGVIDTCSSASQCLSEYPSVNCGLGTCSVAFEGINIMARDYILSSIRHRTGIVMADFPGDGLISAIIGINRQNTPPTVTASGFSTLEGGSGIVSGTITDPDANDSFAMSISWSDGTTGHYSYPAGTTSYSASHLYLDDNPSGTPSDVYPISVQVSDGNGGNGSASTSLTVYNSPPVVTFNAITDSRGNTIGPIPPNSVGVALEGLEVLIDVSFSDAGIQDTHSASLSWGDGSTWSSSQPTTPVRLSHVFMTAGSYTISLTVLDDDTGSGNAARHLTVATPQGAVQDIVGYLEGRLADRHTDPATVALINKALGVLRGQRGGAANNGAFDKLVGGNWNAALVQLRKAIEFLEAAGLRGQASQIVLAAKSLMLKLANGAATANERQARAVADARALIASADAAASLTDAIDVYQQALVALRPAL